MKKIFNSVLILIGFSTVQIVSAQNQDILAVVDGSKIYSSLQIALKNADMVESLKEKGPYTFFAPSNLAFDKMAPENTFDDLNKPENKEKLRGMISYLILKEKIDLFKLSQLIKAGKGKTNLTTIENEKIMVSLDGKKIKLSDERGNHAYIIGAGKKATNGIVYEIDQVLLPKKKD